jgi:hypothetical protein
MAIIDTFERCLKGPYLFADPEAPARVARLLEFAEDRLGLCDAILVRGTTDLDGVNQYGYEAMLACIRALVYSRGYREAGLRCLMLACEKLRVETGELDPGFMRSFELVQGRRTRPEEARDAATSFLQRVREILTP